MRIYRVTTDRTSTPRRWIVEITGAPKHPLGQLGPYDTRAKAVERRRIHITADRLNGIEAREASARGE